MYAFTSLGSGGRPPTIFCKCWQHRRFVESCNARHAWIQRWDLHTWWLWSHPSDERTEEPEQAESQECKQCQQSHNYPSNKTKVFWLQIHWYTDCLQHCCNLKLTKRIQIMYTVVPIALLIVNCHTCVATVPTLCIILLLPPVHGLPQATCNRLIRVQSATGCPAAAIGCLN